MTSYFEFRLMQATRSRKHRKLQTLINDYLKLFSEHNDLCNEKNFMTEFDMMIIGQYVDNLIVMNQIFWKKYKLSTFYIVQQYDFIEKIINLSIKYGFDISSNELAKYMKLYQKYKNKKSINVAANQLIHTQEFYNKKIGSEISFENKIFASHSIEIDWKNKMTIDQLSTIDSSEQCNYDKFQMIMMNLISPCQYRVSSMVSLITSDYNSNYISKNFIDKYDYQNLIIYDKLPSPIFKDNEYRKIGTMKIYIGIGLFYKQIEFIVLQNDLVESKDHNDDADDDNTGHLWHSFARFGIIISMNVLKNFRIEIAGGSNEIKQSIMMIDTTEIFMNNNEIFDPKLDYDSIDNHDEIVYIDSWIKFEVKPSYPENFWLTKILHHQIFSIVNIGGKNENGKLLNSILPIKINIENQQNNQPKNDLYLISSMKIYYSIPMAICGGSLNHFNNDDSKKYESVLVYLIMHGKQTNACNGNDETKNGDDDDDDDDNNNNNNNNNSNSSSSNNNNNSNATKFLIKFIPSDFIIIEQIENQYDNEKLLWIFNYIHMNIS